MYDELEELFKRFQLLFYLIAIIVYVLILRILNLKYIWNIIDHMTILTISIYLCYPYYIYMYIFRKDRISASVNKSKENIIKYNNCK